MQSAVPQPDVRPAAVAGMFYPDDPAALRQTVSESLRLAEAEIDPSGSAPRALIAPHAGYVYSGPIAASAYARLAKVRDTIRRVVLIGPAHRVAFHGIATTTAAAFATPLGNVTVDRDAVGCILDLPFVHDFAEAHAPEHSLEVHLPFLMAVLDEFAIVPLAMGDTSPGEIQQVFEALYDEQTVLLVSSDLSHYHAYEQAVQLDTATSQAIEAMRPEDITHDQACGRLAIQALLVFARQHGLRPHCVDQRNSGDTAGPHDRVVGYGAYVFEPAT